MTALLLPLAGCAAGPVTIKEPPGAAAVAAVCRTFLQGLPDRVDEQPSRQVEPSGVLGRAWGKPAITLTCGVAAPGQLAAGSTCVKVAGVSWYADRGLAKDQSLDARLTVVGFTPRVAVLIPHDYRPEGVNAVLDDLAPAVKAGLRRTTGCS